MNNGTVIGGVSPLSVALGSVRTTGVLEPSSMFSNPALTASQPFSIQFSGASISWSERVIESDVDKTIRTLMTNNTGTAAVVFPMRGFVFGAGIAKVAEYGYDGFHFRVIDEGEQPVGVDMLFVEGGQWETLGSIARELNESISAGVSVGLRTADADYSFEFQSLHFLWEDSSVTWDIHTEDFVWHAGLASQGEIFDSGVSYSSETEHMEAILAIGVSAYAEHLKRITVGFEAELTSPFDLNRFLGKLFITMPLTKRLNLLTSASFDDQRVANRAGFGFGLGFSGDISRFTLSGGILNRFKARRNSAFPDEQAERVDDAATIITFGITRRLGDLF